MLKKLIFSFILILVTYSGFSQGPYKYAYSNDITVTKNGRILGEAWSGGLNNPQFNHLDVNFDCYKDIVIFDKSNNVIRVYINDTTSVDPLYHYAPEYARFFPSDLTDFVLLRDYNGDGKEDIFTYLPGGIKVYKNVSDSILKFELLHERLPAIIFGNPSNVYCISIDYPNISDIDNDGDLDIISINVWGTFAELYENISTDPDTMIFERSNSCWGNFHENQLNDSIVLNSGCKGNGGGNGSAARHTGATLTTLDLYGNGAVDLLLGDIGYNNLVMLRNGGSSTSASMISTDYHYPGSTSVEIDIPTFPVAFYLDVNNNGRNDLIVSTNGVDEGIDTGNVWFYDNFGANNHPNFQLDRKNLLVGEQIDVGTMALPVLADISGDGISDLIIGNIGYLEDYNSNTFEIDYSSRIAYYKNIGTANNPAYDFVTDDLAGVSTRDLLRVTPTFADLDGDGDNDMLVGENNGVISYYENTAATGAQANFVLVSDTFMNQNFGVQPSPLLYDVDGDSKYDLVVGQKNGNIHLYLNQGTISSPVFSNSATDTLGGIFNYIAGSLNNAVPFIGALNGDTNKVLVVADGAGNILFYDGIGSNFMGQYTMVDSIKVSNSMVSVTGGNLNANDSLELIIGERTGGLLFYNMDDVAFAYSPYPRDTCGQNVPDAIWEINNPAPSFDIYPNPNNGSFRVEINTKEQGSGVISIIDLSGKTIGMQNFNSVQNSKFDFNNQDIKPGIYIVQIQISESVYRSKLVIQ
jgi:hypothetical protein